MNIVRLGLRLLAVAIGIAFCVMWYQITGEAYTEVITGNAESIEKSSEISVVGMLTEDERQQIEAGRQARLNAGKALAEGEIERQHEQTIEILKFQNALMLERASAPRVSVGVSTGMSLTNTLSPTLSAVATSETSNTNTNSSTSEAKA